MERCVRMVLALLLGVLAAGEAYGQDLDQTGTWRYEEVDPGKTCKIQLNYGSEIAGDVIIPERLTPENGGDELLVTEIMAYAFQSGDGITSVTIPSSVTAIGEGAFEGCKKLIAIKVDARSKSFSSDGVALFSYHGEKLIFYPRGKHGAYAIPSGVVEIGRYAFGSCLGLTEVAIPSSVKTIGRGAFSGCIGLARVAIPNGVKTIEKEVFSFCTGLTAVTIPSSVTSIEQVAFGGCRGLAEVTIPSSVTHLGLAPFFHCIGLKEIKVDADSRSFSSVGGVLFSYDKKTIVCCPPGGKKGAYTIPDNVTAIGAGAFTSCVGLTSVTIPNSVKSIERGAFGYCFGLTYVDIPSSVGTIGEYAFSACTGLTRIDIPSSVSTIGEGVFDDCEALKEINVDPDSRSFSSAEGVLFNKDKTTIILYPEGKEGEYTIPSSVNTVASDAFATCAGLKAVTIPESVKTINDAFYSCSNLAMVRWRGDARVKVSDRAFNTSSQEKRVLRVSKGHANDFIDLKWVKKGGFTVSDAQAVVVLDANGGSFPDGSSRKIVELQNTPGTLSESEATALSKNGCNFQGYFKVGATEKFDFSKEITDDLVLVARWDRYVVQFTVREDYYESLEGAEVKVGGLSGKTNGKGEASFLLANGTYPYTVSLANHETQSGRLVVQDRDPENEYVKLYKLPQGGSTPTPPSVGEYTLMVAPAANGSVRVTRDNAQGEELRHGAKLKEGDRLFIVATPAVDYELETLTVNGANQANGSVFTVGTANVAVAATFKAKGGATPPAVADYTLTVTPGAHGFIWVTRNDAQGEELKHGAKLKAGDKLFIVATPAEGYELETLTVNGNAQANSSVFTVGKKNVAVAATFKAKGGATPPSAVESVLLAAARVVQNPIANALVLEGIGAAERIEVYSLTGVQTYACAPQGEERVEIATGSWAIGTYVVRIIAADGEKAIRVVKR